jgi:hypothetical protein
VAYACNPSYLRGRDQEDHGSKPIPANSMEVPISKTSNTHNKGGWQSGPSGRVPA